MSTYVFKYKKYNGFFWKKIVVSGHAYTPETDKMVLYMPNGTIREVAHWKDYEIFLGLDWKEFTRAKASKEAGVGIELEL